MFVAGPPKGRLGIKDKRSFFNMEADSDGVAAEDDENSVVARVISESEGRMKPSTIHGM